MSLDNLPTSTNKVTQKITLTEEKMFEIIELHLLNNKLGNARIIDVEQIQDEKKPDSIIIRFHYSIDDNPKSEIIVDELTLEKNDELERDLTDGEFNQRVKDILEN